MMTAMVFRLSSGLLPAVCAFLATGWFAQTATAQSLPPGAYQIAQALSPEERAKRRAARKARREGRAAGNGERRQGNRQRRDNARNARPAPQSGNAVRPAPPAAQPARRARPAARPARQARPPAAVVRRAPVAAPRKRRGRKTVRKIKRSLKKLFKRSRSDERRVGERRAAERWDVPRRRATDRLRDPDQRRFRDARRPYDDGRGVRRAPERRRLVVPEHRRLAAPPRRERLERRDFERRERVHRRRRVARRSYNRDARRYARSRRHVVQARRYRNRFHRGRSIYYLPPAGVALAASLYALDSSRASYDDYYDTFMAPPVRRLPRHYSLSDIVADPGIRGAVRSVNIDIITFYSGSARIPAGQLHKLEDLADAIHATLRRRPDEVFLIAGHTDAVGSFATNLNLSQRRAAAVLDALVETFEVPEENLESVGYGEQYLRIDTDGPDRRNRRVVVRAIGALLARR